MIFKYHITRITPSAAAYEPVGCIHFHSQQYGRAGCTPFLNAGMSDCPASSQSGTGMNKMLMLESVQDRIKGTYGTGLRYAGMPMPAASASMPMPAMLKGQFNEISLYDV